MLLNSNRWDWMASIRLMNSGCARTIISNHRHQTEDDVLGPFADSKRMPSAANDLVAPPTIKGCADQVRRIPYPARCCRSEPLQATASPAQYRARRPPTPLDSPHCQRKFIQPSSARCDGHHEMVIKAPSSKKSPAVRAERKAGMRSRYKRHTMEEASAPKAIRGEAIGSAGQKGKPRRSGART